MLAGMTGRGQRPQCQPAQIHLITLAQTLMGELAAPCRRPQHSGAVHRSQLHCPRQEVRTKVYYRLAGSDVAALWAGLRDVASTHVANVDRVRGAYLGADDVDEVARDELLRRLAAGDVTLVDVRPSEEYAAGHIPGALSLPLNELAERLASLPSDTTIVAYCRGPYCVLAHEAVRALTASGLHAIRLRDGMIEWRLANLPVAV